MVIGGGVVVCVLEVGNTKKFRSFGQDSLC